MHFASTLAVLPNLVVSGQTVPESAEQTVRNHTV